MFAEPEGAGCVFGLAPSSRSNGVQWRGTGAAGFELASPAHYVRWNCGFGLQELTVIIILALVALFIGLRPYSVLGERTGHEQQPILKPADPDARVERPVAPTPQQTQAAPDAADLAYLPTAGPGVRALPPSFNGRISPASTSASTSMSRRFPTK